MPQALWSGCALSLYYYDYTVPTYLSLAPSSPSVVSLSSGYRRKVHWKEIEGQMDSNVGYLLSPAGNLLYSIRDENNSMNITLHNFH